MRSISVFEQTLVSGGDGVFNPDVYSDGFAGNGWQGGGAYGAMGGSVAPSLVGTGSIDGQQVAGVGKIGGNILVNIISNYIYDNFGSIYRSPAPTATPSSDMIGNPTNFINVFGA